MNKETYFKLGVVVIVVLINVLTVYQTFVRANKLKDLIDGQQEYIKELEIASSCYVENDNRFDYLTCVCNSIGGVISGDMNGRSQGHYFSGLLCQMEVTEEEFKSRHPETYEEEKIEDIEPTSKIQLI